MKLRPEYEKIRSDAVHTTAIGGYNSWMEAIHVAVLRCQELADKPPKELTEAELSTIWLSVWPNLGTLTPNDFKAMRSVEAAAHAKQKESTEIPFDYDKWKTGEWVAVAPEGWIAEAISPLRQYTMRRKS